MKTAAHYAKSLEGAETGAAQRGAEQTPPSPTRIIEALLFVGDRPLRPEAAIGAIRGLTREQFRASIDELNRLYRRQSRPYAIHSHVDEFTLGLKANFIGLGERLSGNRREARLTVPMLDVLALVAYKQPVTRNEVDAARGADSIAILRQLVRLQLITVQDALPGGTEPAYNTAPRFLELFGLASLDDLPKTADLQKI